MHKRLFLKFIYMTVFACALTLCSPGVNPFLASAYGQCAEDDTGALDIAGSSGSQGGTVNITVRIKNAPNVVDSLGFDVTYDPAILQYTGFDKGGCVTGFDFFNANKISDGTIRAGGFTTSNAIQAGANCNVVVLKFNVLTCADTSLGLQALVDDVAAWTKSGGCFSCGAITTTVPPTTTTTSTGGGGCSEDDTGALDIVGSSGSQGGTVNITVRIKNAPNVVDSLGFDVTYDPAILQYTGFDKGGCVTGFDFFNANKISDGTIRAGGFTTSNAIQAGANCNVVVLKFNVLTCADTSLGLQALVDDVASWTKSGGCFGCGTPPSTTTTSAIVNGPKLESACLEALPGALTPVAISFTQGANDGQPGGPDDITAVQFDVDYDRDKLTFDPTDSNQDGIPDAITFTVPGSFSPGVIIKQDGKINISIVDFFPPLALIPNGNIISIKFRVKQGTPASSQACIDMLAPTFSDRLANSIEGTAIPCCISVIDCGPIKGDCNNDGKLDIADAVCVILKIAEGAAYNPCYDMNCDGRIDISDVVGIILKIAGQPTPCDTQTSSPVMPASAATESSFGSIAPAAAAPQIQVSDVAGQPNAVVDVPVNFTQGDNDGQPGGPDDITAVQLDIDYDQTNLTFDPTDGDQDGIPDAITFSIPGAFSPGVIIKQDGKINIAVVDFFPPLALIPSGKICSIKFTVKADPVSPITICPVNASFSDRLATSISGDVICGTITIGCTNDASCSDGNVCNGQETCQAGTCQPGTPLICEDNNSCTTDTCDPTAGCQYTPVNDGTACNDNNACTQTDSCQEGVCTGSNTVTCSPLDQCHDAGTCDPATGQCSNPAKPDGTSCSDDTFCNGQETCNNGTCQPGTNPCPDDGQFCTGVESCNEDTNQCVATGNPCPDDGLFCTGVESCNEDTNQCVTTGTPCPDDGLFCNGTENCIEETDACGHAGDPCAAELKICDEKGDACNDVVLSVGSAAGDPGDCSTPIPIALANRKSVSQIVFTLKDELAALSYNPASCGSISIAPLIENITCTAAASLAAPLSTQVTITEITAAEGANIVAGDSRTLANLPMAITSNAPYGATSNLDISNIDVRDMNGNALTVLAITDTFKVNKSTTTTVPGGGGGGGGGHQPTTSTTTTTAPVVTTTTTSAPQPPPPECTNDAGCDDGIFCNGSETCVNGACQSGVSTCESGQLCKEDLKECWDSMQIQATAFEKQIWRPFIFEQRCQWIVLTSTGANHFNALTSSISFEGPDASAQGVSLNQARKPFKLGPFLFDIGPFLFIPACVEKDATQGNWTVKIKTDVTDVSPSAEETIAASFIVK